MFQNLQCKSVGAFLNAWREKKAVINKPTGGSDESMALYANDREAVQDLRQRLAQVGLGLVCPGRDFSYDRAMLFVPLTSSGHRELVDKTDFAGPRKLAQALRQMPEDWIEHSVKGSIEGRAMKGVGVRLAKALPVESDEDA